MDQTALPSGLFLPSIMEMMIIDLAGNRYGRWFVIDLSHVQQESRSRNVYWLCQCDCGTVRPVITRSLVEGLSTGCGCERYESRKVEGRLNEDGTRTLTYLSWDNMMGRCYRPSQPDFDKYGGRGIQVCERWKTYSNFLSDMGHRPRGTTIERLDVNGHYEPGNCKWATNTEQQSNKTNTVKVIYQSQEMTLIKASEMSGISIHVLRNRFRNGDRDDRLFRPVRNIQHENS